MARIRITTSESANPPVRRIAILLLAVPFANSTVAAQSDGPAFEKSGMYAGSYLCTAKASGGVRWNENHAEWQGSHFAVSDNDHFVLDLEMVEPKEWESFGWELSGATYLANVKRLGDDEGVSCWGDRVGYQPKDLVGFGHILMTPQGEFQCNAYGHLTRYWFNLETKRYFETYLEGFIDGKDTDENTPNLTAGICTKLD